MSSTNIESCPGNSPSWEHKDLPSQPSHFHSCWALFMFSFYVSKPHFVIPPPAINTSSANLFPPCTQLTLDFFKSVTDLEQDSGQHGHLQGSPRLLVRPHGRPKLQVSTNQNVCSVCFLPPLIMNVNVEMGFTPPSFIVKPELLILTPRI